MTHCGVRGLAWLRAFLAMLGGCLGASCLIACDGSVSGSASLGQADSALPDRQWHAVFEDLDALVLAGWAASDDDAFFVGAEGQVMRYRSGRWYRLEVPTRATLWWVWGTSAEDLYVGGEEGTLLHFDGSSWSRVETGLDPTQTIWGIWGARADDVWLVGGNARSNGPGFVLRGDRRGFRAHDLGAELPNLFKVWGTNRDDVLLVGDHGTVIQVATDEVEIRYLDPDGEAGRVESLFTVAGNAAGEIVAVGGVSSGLLFEKQGSAWEFRDPQSLGLNGVAVAESGEAFAVGLQGTIRHRIDGQWHEQDFAHERHYHSAVLMGDVVFAVGGDLLSPKSERRGLIVASESIAGGEIRLIPAVTASGVDAGGSDASVPSSIGQTPVLDAGPDPRPTVDSGLVEAGTSPPDPVDASALPGAAEPCSAQGQCAATLECWLIQAEEEDRCVTPCSSAQECPAEYGPDPQCAVPGCQTLYTVCMPAGWKGCF